MSLCIMRSEELIRLRGDSEEREKAEGTLRFLYAMLFCTNGWATLTQLLTIEPNLYELNLIEVLCLKHKAVD